MGIYLSSPDTRKDCHDGQGKLCRFGASAMQGWRLNMEDDHISDASFDGDTCLFAIFDGHGGCEVAKFCAKHFGEQLKKNSNYHKNSKKTQKNQKLYKNCIYQNVRYPSHFDDFPVIFYETYQKRSFNII